VSLSTAGETIPAIAARSDPALAALVP